LKDRHKNLKDRHKIKDKIDQVEKDGYVLFESLPYSCLVIWRYIPLKLYLLSQWISSKIVKYALHTKIILCNWRHRPLTTVGNHASINWVSVNPIVPSLGLIDVTIPSAG
jgi:hypothetical protein